MPSVTVGPQALLLMPWGTHLLLAIIVDSCHELAFLSRVRTGQLLAKKSHLFFGLGTDLLRAAAQWPSA